MKISLKSLQKLIHLIRVRIPGLELEDVVCPLVEMKKRGRAKHPGQIGIWLFLITPSHLVARR